MINIQNRRYLGNKYKLLPFIENVVQTHCPGAKSLLDIFAGTGVVAHHFSDKMTVMTAEILYSNYLSNMAFIGKRREEEVGGHDEKETNRQKR